MTDEQLEKAIKCWTGTTVSEKECMACPYNDKCTLEEIANEIIHRWRECKTENAALRERLEKYKISFKKVYMDFFSKLNRDKDFRKRFDNVTLGCQLTMFEDALDKAEARLAELKGE